jgi:hypothetical protein
MDICLLKACALYTISKRKNLKNNIKNENPAKTNREQNFNKFRPDSNRFGSLFAQSIKF